MEKNDKVIVESSSELIQMGLADLIDRKGVIVEVMRKKNGQVRGAWVQLSAKPFMGELEWYIPVGALRLE